MNLRYTSFDFYQKDAVKLLGRTTVENNALLLAWSSNGFEMNFSGSGFILELLPFTGDEAYLRIFCDGTAKRYEITSSSRRIVFDCASDGFHTARVLRVTEGEPLVGIASVTLIGTAPELLPRPADKPLKLEFLGDSITCGYGVRAPKDIADFRLFEEDSTVAYAYRTAEGLNADAWCESISGKGILKNCNGDPNDIKITEFFHYTTQRRDLWDHTKFTPDIVIINAGTNDAWGGVTDDEFRNTALAFLADVRATYPSAAILWAYGVMDVSKLPCIEKTVAEFNTNDGNAFFLSLHSIGELPGEVGGGGHPNTDTSFRVAGILAGKIKEILRV